MLLYKLKPPSIIPECKTKKWFNIYKVVTACVSHVWLHTTSLLLGSATLGIGILLEAKGKG